MVYCAPGVRALLSLVLIFIPPPLNMAESPPFLLAIMYQFLVRSFCHRYPAITLFLLQILLFYFFIFLRSCEYFFRFADLFRCCLAISFLCVLFTLVSYVRLAKFLFLGPLALSLIYLCMPSSLHFARWTVITTNLYPVLSVSFPASSTRLKHLSIFSHPKRT